MLSDTQIQGMRSSRDLLQKELEGAGVQFKGKYCRCPFHDDHTPSADVYERDGVWRFHCFPCNRDGDIFDVRAWLNKTTPQDELKREAMKAAPSAPMKPDILFESIEAAAKLPKLESIFRYTNPTTGAVELAVARWWDDSKGKKSFTQITPRGDKWVRKGLKKSPIYNRARLAGATSVVIVEGEKKVHALHKMGVIATCCPGGSGAGEAADWTPLAGKKCILWQDNDDPGTKFMNTVRGILRDLGCSLSRVIHESLELPEKGDVCDFIARYGADENLAREAVADVIADARPLGTLGDYVEETEKIIGGQRRSLPFPWRNLTSFARALMPGTVTCVFGPPGSAKSLFLSECLSEWLENDIKACVFHLEDDRNYHLRRVHAQLASDSRINSNDWIEQDAPAFRASRDHFSGRLAEIGDCIWDAPDEEVSFEMLEKWVEERAKAGFQIIMIDPVTAAQSTEKVWIADQKFIFRVKTIARRHNTRIILVTHPKKGQKPAAFGLDDMAGGAAYQRFSHTVLLLERNDKEEQVMVREGGINFPAVECTPDRILKIAKARNGPGAGRRIAYTLQSDTLRFHEIGVVEKI